MALKSSREIGRVIRDAVAFNIQNWQGGRMASDSLIQEVTDQKENLTQAHFDGLQIDVLLTQNPLFKSVKNKHAKVQPFLERNIPIVSVEGLLLLKLYALPSLYRQGNFARVEIYESDIATLLHDYKPDVAALLNELSSYVSESDLTEIKAILGDIQERIERFEKGQR
jgi:hypothetical protein